MITDSASGVYNETQDFSQVPSLISTSVGAIVYTGGQGPLEPRLYTNINDWWVANGKPDPSISFAPYCAKYYLAQANQLWGVRAVGPGYSFGGAALQQLVPSIAPTLTAITTSDPRPINIGGQGVDWGGLGTSTNPQQNLAYFYANGPGSYSGAQGTTGIAVEIQSDNLTVPTGVVPVDSTTVGPLLVGVNLAGSIQPGTYYYRVSAVNRVGESLASTETSVVITASNVSVYVPWNPVPGAQGYNIYGRTTGNEQLIASVGGGAKYYLDYGTIVPSGLPQVTQSFTQAFTVNVYSDQVSLVTPAETFSVSLLDSSNGLGIQLEIEQQINGISNYIRVASNVTAFLTVPTVFSIAKTYLSAGSSGTAVTASDLINAWSNFEDPDRYSVQLLINGGYSLVPVQLAMLSLAESRGDAFCILDMPSSSQDTQAALDYRNLQLNINSNRGAIYTSDVYTTDPFSGKQFYCPPSGITAGVYAYTDNATFPWYAPAGLNRANLPIVSARYSYDLGDRDQLKNVEINYIRNMPGIGIAIMEARTLQTSQSALSFVSVRRLLDNIQAVAKKAQLYNLFEQNNAYTRTKVKGVVDTYCQYVANNNGINQWLTICDDRNNPSFLASQGILVCDVLIEPTLPVERILMRYTITAQGVDLTSLVAQGIIGSVSGS